MVKAIFRPKPAPSHLTQPLVKSAPGALYPSLPNSTSTKGLEK